MDPTTKPYPEPVDYSLISQTLFIQDPFQYYPSTYTYAFQVVFNHFHSKWTFNVPYFFGDTRWRRWLRHCITRRKVAGSIPNGITEIFHWRNSFCRTTVLGSTHPLKEVSTMNTSRGLGLTTLTHSGVDCLEILEPQNPGIRGAYTFFFYQFFCSLAVRAYSHIHSFSHQPI